MVRFLEVFFGRNRIDFILGSRERKEEKKEFSRRWVGWHSGEIPDRKGADTGHRAGTIGRVEWGNSGRARDFRDPKRHAGGPGERLSNTATATIRETRPSSRDCKWTRSSCRVQCYPQETTKWQKVARKLVHMINKNTTTYLGDIR